MPKIEVPIKGDSYFVDVRPNAINDFATTIRNIPFTGPIVVITDRTVWAKLKTKIRPALDKTKKDLIFAFVPAGERAKSLDVFRDVVKLISRRASGYNPLIVAVGGGVVGDLAGFVAATYRRGVSLVQVPTTLLAQVDSSIGGKVAIDLPEAKNLVGAFYQPDAVITDIALLKTLPKKQIQNGLSEMIKYGVIANKGLFVLLEQNIDALLALEEEPITKAISDCIRIKADVVKSDVRDNKGVRIILNFGHTLGHAIEAASGYDGYSHGEAVALGMLLAGDIARDLGLFPADQNKRLSVLIKKASLPTRIKGFSSKDILDRLRYDKKFISGYNRFVLPERIGKVKVFEKVPLDLIETTLDGYVGS